MKFSRKEERSSSSEEEDESQVENLDEALGDIPYELLVNADRKTNRIDKRSERAEREKEKVKKLKKESRKAHGKDGTQGSEGPKEKSAKVKVSKERVVFQPKQFSSIDPRFAGEPMDDFKRTKFYENYEFLKDLKVRENQMMGKEIRRLSRKRNSDPNDKKIFKEAIGDNKTSLKNFEKKSTILKFKEQIKEDIRLNGDKVRKVDLKRALQQKIKEMKSSKKSKQKSHSRN